MGHAHAGMGKVSNLRAVVVIPGKTKDVRISLAFPDCLVFYTYFNLCGRHQQALFSVAIGLLSWSMKKFTGTALFATALASDLKLQ